MKKVTPRSLYLSKQNQEKFAVITAYDSTQGRLAEAAEIEVILVGDSLGNVIQGQRSTVPVTLDDMVYHTQCVRRGVNQSLLMVDMPYMSYSTREQAIQNATALMQAGADMVKLEGGEWLVDTVRFLSERGIPVCSHLGLLPQSVNKTSGYRVQGRDPKDAEQMLLDARAMEEAGADLLLLECIPAALAKQLSQQITLPVIGIGAGPDTDAQVLVMYDMLGISPRIPSFAKNYMNDGGSIQDALARFSQEVKSCQFPGSEFVIE